MRLSIGSESPVTGANTLRVGWRGPAGPGATTAGPLGPGPADLWPIAAGPRGLWFGAVVEGGPCGRARGKRGGAVKSGFGAPGSGCGSRPCGINWASAAAEHVSAKQTSEIAGLEIMPFSSGKMPPCRTLVPCVSETCPFPTHASHGSSCSPTGASRKANIVPGQRRGDKESLSIADRSLLRRGRIGVAIRHFDGLHRLPVLQAVARVQHDSIIRLQPGRNLRVRSAVAGDFDFRSPQPTVMHDKHRERRIAVVKQAPGGNAQAFERFAQINRGVTVHAVAQLVMGIRNIDLGPHRFIGAVE